jgi:hypothetical protein
MRARLGLLILSFCFGMPVLACSGDGGTAPHTCTGPFVVQVTNPTAIRPVFSWPAACAGYVLDVFYSPSPGVEQLMWHIQTSLNNDIAAPVTYGIDPPNLSSGGTPIGLETDSTYTVRVQRWDTAANGPGPSGTGVFVH